MTAGPHEMQTSPDLNLPHLVTGWCSGCDWRWSGFSREFVLRLSFNRKHGSSGKS